MTRECHVRFPAVMLGVGAAFDFIAGSKPQAPRWMMRIGLEWLFRGLVSDSVCRTRFQSSLTTGSVMEKRDTCSLTSAERFSTWTKSR